MLEKIGLPEKPSIRGNNWVIDASHCQLCSSHFTFINRKHHCRRCGGLFCGTCTQKRMVLRGQGDSPVRICDPCKKLEEAARFELRHGIKKKAARGSSKFTSKNEDEILEQVLGREEKDLISSKSNASSSSYSAPEEHDTPDNSSLDVEPSSPEELRQQAVEEKNKYKTLRAEGKPQEALKAFKRGKELERQAGALEISLRKNRRKASILVATAEVQNIDDVTSSSGRKNESKLRKSKDKDDISSELKELGWSDMDLHNAEKKPAPMSLEGELFSLLGEVSQKTGTENTPRGSDKSQVLALKKQALALKKEGKLGEAKEKLKEAKILEKQLEEQEFLGEDEESDDELSALIRGMDNGNKDDMEIKFHSGPGFNFDQILTDDIDGNFEVTDEDMYDPEMDAALKSLGWDEETNNHLEDRVSISVKIQNLKKEALGQKRAGNSIEAMDLLKKAKLLEKDLDASSTLSESPPMQYDNESTSVKTLPRSRLMLQKELLGIKKKALTLRREGKPNEADEELRKGKVLEQQLEEMDSNGPKLKDKAVHVSRKLDESMPLPNIGDEVEAVVTDTDMSDPAYLGLLKNLGWDEEDDKISPVAKAESALPRRSKGEIQRELLGLKRKALTLRRQGNNEEAEETLNMAKVLESQLEEMEVPKKEPKSQVEADVTDTDMSNPAYLGLLKNLGWDEEDDKIAPVAKAESALPRRSKGEIQRELLGLKRKALTLRRQGNNEEAEETLNMAKVLESQLEEMEVPKKEPKSQVEADVTDTDMSNPAYLGLLKNLGWDEEDDKIAPVAKAESALPRKSKGEIQRELLGLKRKALTLRRQGNNEEAEETLNMAKVLESQLEEMEVPKKEPKSEIQNHFEGNISVKEEDNVVTWSNDKIHHEKREEVIPRDENLVTVHSTIAKNEESSPGEQILSLKRNAVMLKKRGMITEAKEELRRAKILEKKLEENSFDQGASSSSTPDLAPVVKNENNLISKKVSSRDRFKLQQESLGLKRLSRKLRMEGRNEEADAEFEKAKAIEAQLEELTEKSATSGSNPVDDVSVDDFLDPQLLSALRAVGIDNSSSNTQNSNNEPPKMSVGERAELEEQIKAEKGKAVALKRLGKQAEALDALRRAKMFEKKLNSLSS